MSCLEELGSARIKEAMIDGVHDKTERAHEEI